MSHTFTTRDHSIRTTSYLSRHSWWPCHATPDDLVTPPLMTLSRHSWSLSKPTHITLASLMVAHGHTNLVILPVVSSHFVLIECLITFSLIQVADFLAKRRDNLFLEFDISISHSVRDTFLSTGNEAAYRVSMRGLDTSRLPCDRIFRSRWFRKPMILCARSLQGYYGVASTWH